MTSPAIVDLVISGAGRAPQQRSDALVEQLVWAGVRRRRIVARTALSHHLLRTLDLIFPGLDGCFDDLLGSKVRPVLLHNLADPARLHRLGVEGLRAFTARRGVRLQRRKAEQLHQAAADALGLPAAERACRATVLAADLAVRDMLNNQIDPAEQHLTTFLPNTPAGVLTSLPGIGVVRASNYGGPCGDRRRSPVLRTFILATIAVPIVIYGLCRTCVACAPGWSCEAPERDARSVV